MKLNEIINESWRVEQRIGNKSGEKTPEQLADYLLMYCADAVKNLMHTPILRSQYSGGDNISYVVKGSEGHRQSANTTNYYTVILDETLPAEYPRRSKSIICGTYDNSQATGYGSNLYAVFPHDDVKIGVCAGEDIWNSTLRLFKNRKRPITEINDALSLLKTPTTSFDDIVNHLATIVKFGDDRVLKQLPEKVAKEADEAFRNLETYFPNIIGMSKEQIEKSLREAYSPEHLAFELATTKNVGQLNNRELWIGGTCMLIPMEVYESKVKQILNSKGMA